MKDNDTQPAASVQLAPETAIVKPLCAMCSRQATNLTPISADRVEFRCDEHGKTSTDAPAPLSPEDRALAVARDCTHLPPSAGPCGECIAGAIRVAVAEETEGCARFIETAANYDDVELTDSPVEKHWRKTMAAGIRARGNP